MYREKNPLLLLKTLIITICKNTEQSDPQLSPSGDL